MLHSGDVVRLSGDVVRLFMGYELNRALTVTSP
jgi:hypothetical protein